MYFLCSRTCIVLFIFFSEQLVDNVMKTSGSGAAGVTADQHSTLLLKVSLYVNALRKGYALINDCLCHKRTVKTVRYTPCAGCQHVITTSAGGPDSKGGAPVLKVCGTS